jgi:hypothetical protein
MFKLLYKTLLISVLSGSLTMTNMTAFAAGPITKGSDGVLTKTETHNFSGVQSDNAMNVITMLVVGAVGMKLALYEKLTPDMTVAAIGSAAYIAGEIMSTIKFKEKIKDSEFVVSKRSDGKKDQAQIDSLVELKQSYENAKKSAKSKIMLQQAAAAAFVVAAGVAGYELLVENSQLASCTSALATANASLTSCSAAATPATATEAAACAACMVQISALVASLPTVAAADNVPAPSCGKLASSGAKNKVQIAQNTAPCAGVTAETIKASASPLCATYLATKEMNWGYSCTANLVARNTATPLEKILFANTPVEMSPTKMSLDNSMSSRNLLNNMLDLIFPKAHAANGVIGLLGLGAAAATVFFTVKTALGKTIDTIMFTPGQRIAAWGVMAAAAGASSMATNNEIDKMNDNVKKIDKVLEELNKLEIGIKTQNVNDQQITLTNFAINPNEQIPYNSDPKIKTECLGAPGTNNCPPIANQFKSLPGYAGLPDSFKSLMSQTAKLGDGLSGKNMLSGSTLASANSLGGQTNAIGKMTASIKTKINDALGASGKPKIDFGKEEKNLWAKLKSQTGNALKSSNMSPGAFLSSTGLSPIADANAAIAKVPNSNSKTVSGTEGAAVEAPKEKGFDLDFKEDKSASVEAAAVAPTKEEKYDIGSNDINTNSGDSIFQVISNRYLKSGYPKLLEEIEVKK